MAGAPCRPARRRVESAGRTRSDARGSHDEGHRRRGSRDELRSGSRAAGGCIGRADAEPEQISTSSGRRDRAHVEAERRLPQCLAHGSRSQADARGPRRFGRAPGERSDPPVWRTARVAIAPRGGGPCSAPDPPPPSFAPALVVQCLLRGVCMQRDVYDFNNLRNSPRSEGGRRAISVCNQA